MEEQGVQEEHDSQHLQAFFNGDKHIVGEVRFVVIINIPCFQHLHPQRSSDKQGTRNEEQGTSLEWKGSKKPQVGQGNDEGEGATSDHPWEIPKSMEITDRLQHRV